MKKLLLFCSAVLLAVLVVGCESEITEQKALGDITSTTPIEQTGEPPVKVSEKPESATESTNAPDENEFLRASAEEFLYDYLSLFSDKAYSYTYEYSEEKGYSDPVYIDPVSGLPISIDESPFILNGVLIAFDYCLYDLNNDGALDIIISYGKPESDYIIHIMYKLVDGKYKEIYHAFTNPEFYTDKRGKTVLRFGSDISGIYGVYYADINDEELSLDVIVDENFYNHITQKQLDYKIFFENDAVIPDMPDEPLEKIEPLFLLKEEITDSIINKLKADNKM